MLLKKTFVIPDISKVPDGPIKDYLRKLEHALQNHHRVIYNDFNQKCIYNLKSGATQADADAKENERWYTLGHATLPDGILMIGL